MMLKENNIIVSICCLTYDHKDSIEKALNSFLMQQTKFQFEIFVHDDASTDGTTQIIENYQLQYPNLIQSIVQPKNLYYQGISLYEIYTKFAFPRLRGKYIAICEGDDYWTDPFKLQKQIDFLEQNPAYSICFHSVGYVGNEDVDFYEHSNYYKDLFRERNTFNFNDLINDNFITNCSVVYRNVVSSFTEVFNTCSFPDWPLHIIYAQKGNIHYLDEMMAHHRKNEMGIWEGKTLEDRYRMIAVFYLNLIEFADEKYYAAIFNAIECQKKYNTGFLYLEFFKLGMLSGEKRNILKTEELQATLDLIYNSKSWKIADKLRNYSYPIMPKGSRQREVVVGGLLILMKQIIRFLKFLLNTIKLLKGTKEFPKTKNISQKKWPKNKPFISVIIPNYNYGKYIQETIDSVLNQTFTNFEIIVVDGGSNDHETKEILKKIQHPKIRVHFRKGRHFVGDNRNFGINLAKGKYVCCLDSDDKIDSTYLEKALFYLEVLHYEVVYPWIQCFDANNVIWKTADASYENLTQEANVVANTAVYKKSAWRITGGYKDYPIGKGYVCEDWEFWARMSGNGFRFKVIPEILMFYRVHPNSLSQVCETSVNKQMEIIRNENLRFESKKYQHLRLMKMQEISKVRNPFINLQITKIKKRILVALPFMVIGGVDTIFINIFKYLSKKYDVSFYTTVPILEEYGDNTKYYRNFTEEIYHFPRFLNNEAEMKEYILYLIEAKQIDLMFIAGSELTYHCLPEIKMKNQKLKVVDFLFNETGHIENNRKYAQFIDMNIVENERVLKYLSETLNERPEKIRLIHNGVNIEKFSKKIDASEVKQKHGILNGQFVVAYLGRFSNEKNPEAVIALAEKLKDEGIIFFMGGNGPTYNDIINLINKNNLEEIILAPGFVDTIEILSITDVLILPSILDGRPNIVLEAMAMGVPVVASDVGGLSTIIQNNQNGFLIRPHDLDSFSNAILNLKNNNSLHEEIKIASREYAVRALDDRIMLEQYDNFVTTILNNSTVFSNQMN